MASRDVSSYAAILAGVERSAEDGSLTRNQLQEALDEARAIVPAEWLEALYNFARPEWISNG